MPTSPCIVAGVFAALLLAAVPAVAATPADADPSGPLEATLAGEYALQGGQLQEAATWYLRAARASPGDAALAERTARIALLAGEDATAAEALALWRERASPTPAMRAIETSLALRRGDEARATGLAVALASMGEDGWRHALNALGSGGKDLALAGRVLGALVDADAIPARLDPWLAFGGLAQRLDQAALSERIVDEVVARFPDEPRVALLRASQLREAGQPDAARTVLEGLEDAAMRDEDLRLALAAEYDALDDATAAARVLARGPQDEYTLRLRAALLAQAEDKDALVALYGELQEDSARPDPARRLLLGQIAEFLERPGEALRWYRSVPGGPARLQARLRIAAVLHGLDRSEEAFAALHALQADADAHQDARRDAYLLEAELHRDAGDPEAEIDAFARGLAAYPDDPELLYARALAWERRDDIARAEADFRQILVAQPDSGAALNALGYTLADRTDRHVEALELIDRARVAEPDNAAIIDSYGWVLYRLGRNEEALVELRRAFALQKDAEIASHIGEVLWVLGRRDEARDFFERARELDPESRALERALEHTVGRGPQAGGQ